MCWGRIQAGELRAGAANAVVGNDQGGAEGDTGGRGPSGSAAGGGMGGGGGIIERPGGKGQSGTFKAPE